jgi:hypothetical protein
MIGKVNPLGHGFKGLLAYLEKGKDGANPERVEWLETRNLPTRDPEAAARIMAATARQGRAAEPVYHFSISFDPGDPADREAMRRVADRVLHDLGLHEHQTVLVAHGDTLHPHVHVAVNRVHPETTRAWETWKDWPRIERSLRSQEVETGLRVVPGRLAPVPERVREGRVDTGPSAPARRPERGGEVFVREVRECAAVVFSSAKSWAELERGLADHGLRVRVNGRGLSVTDGKREVKASDVARAYSRGKLEARFGAWSDYRARLAVAEPSTPREFGRSGRTAADPSSHSDRNTRPRADGATVGAHFREVARSVKADFQAIYQQPHAARAAFLRAVDATGPAAAGDIRSNPERFGRVRVGVSYEHRARASADAAVYAQFRAERPRAVRVQIVAKLHEHAAAESRQAAFAGAVQSAGRAQTDRSLAEKRREYLARTVDFARLAVREPYADPARSEQLVWRAIRREGAEAVATQLRTEPERFGELRATPRRRALGLWGEADYTEARESAREAAARISAASDAWRNAPTRGELVRLRGTENAAVRRLDELRTTPGPAPSPRALEVEIGSLIQKAATQAERLAGRSLGSLAEGPRELLERAGMKQLRQLAFMVKAPHLAVARQAWDLAIKLARGDHDHDDR